MSWVWNWFAQKSQQKATQAEQDFTGSKEPKYDPPKRPQWKRGVAGCLVGFAAFSLVVILVLLGMRYLALR